jgi:predicted nucleic acid-binding protein
MATAINPGDEVFLDTSYALALSASTDQFHARALRLAEEVDAARAQLVTTRGVLLEIGNALSRQRYRAAAISLLQALERDPEHFGLAVVRRVIREGAAVVLRAPGQGMGAHRLRLFRGDVSARCRKGPDG